MENTWSSSIALNKNTAVTSKQSKTDKKRSKARSKPKPAGAVTPKVASTPDTALTSEVAFPQEVAVTPEVTALTTEVAFTCTPDTALTTEVAFPQEEAVIPEVASTPDAALTPEVAMEEGPSNFVSDEAAVNEVIFHESQSNFTLPIASRAANKKAVLNENIPVIGYIHQLSPVKQSHNNNPYFDMKVQTESRTVRTVCFSLEKHETFKRSFEALSPVKLTQFQLKPNRRTNEEEIVVNKRTKLDNPFEHEITFDITTKELDYATTTTTVTDAKKVMPGRAITVLGRLTFQGGTEHVDVRGKSLKKQETILTDETGSIRLVLWENDIQKVQSRETYMLERSVVREFDNQPYITINKETQISKVSQTIANPDDDLANTYKEFTISCPPEGILATHRSLSCNKCANSMVEHTVAKTIKCTACGLLQLSHLCEEKVHANAFFINENGQKISLLMKQHIIQALLDIHQSKSHSNIVRTLDQITDDELQEILLTVEANITYNNKNIATNVKKNIGH